MKLTLFLLILSSNADNYVLHRDYFVFKYKPIDFLNETDASYQFDEFFLSDTNLQNNIHKRYKRQDAEHEDRGSVRECREGAALSVGELFKLPTLDDFVGVGWDNLRNLRIQRSVYALNYRVNWQKIKKSTEARKEMSDLSKTAKNFLKVPFLIFSIHKV